MPNERASERAIGGLVIELAAAAAAATTTTWLVSVRAYVSVRQTSPAIAATVTDSF